MLFRVISRPPNYLMAGDFIALRRRLAGGIGHDGVILAVIVLLAVAVRACTFVGYRPSNPSCYAALAAGLSQGVLAIPGYEGPPVFPLRLGMYVPTALLVRCFGASSWVFGAYPFLLGVGLCIITYLFGRLLAASVVGLLAAAIVAIVPCATTTSLWTDFCANAWGACALLIMAAALRAASDTRAFLLATMSGALFWVAWIHKESTIMVASIVLAMPWIPAMSPDRRRGVIVLCCTGLSALVLLGAEFLFYRQKTGDFLFRFHEVSRNYDLYSDYFFDPSPKKLGWNTNSFWSVMLHRWLVAGPKSLLANKLLSLLPTFATLSLALCWIMRLRRGGACVLMIWLVSLLLFFNFMSISFSAYRPMPLPPQYLSWLILPSALAVALAAENGLTLAAGRYPSAAATMAVSCLTLVCGIGIYQNTNRMRTQDFIPVERRVAESLDASDVVVTDVNTMKHQDYYRFNVFGRPSGRCLNWDVTSRREAPSDSLVLVNHQDVGYMADIEGYRPPDGWRIADDWKMSRDFGTAVLYELPD